MSAITDRYKIPLLISLVVSLGVLVLRMEGYWLNALLTFVFAIIGILILDFEYVVHAYLIDPMSEVSIRVKETMRSPSRYVAFINQYEHSFGEMPIRSAIFQIMLALFTLYVVTAASPVYIQALALSMYANLLFQQMNEFVLTKHLSRWFWGYTGTLSHQKYQGYMVLMLLFLGCLFYLL